GISEKGAFVQQLALELSTPLLQRVRGPLSGRPVRRAGRSGAPIVVESVGTLLPSAGNLQVVVSGVRVGYDSVHPIADRSREVSNFGLERTYRRSDLCGGGTNLRLGLLCRRTQAGKLSFHSFGRGLDRIGC